VFDSTTGLTGQMWLTFLVCLAGMVLLWITLWRFEITAKKTSAEVKKLRRERAELEAAEASQHVLVGPSA
jgi:hypothetical protein